MLYPKACEGWLAIFPFSQLCSRWWYVARHSAVQLASDNSPLKSVRQDIVGVMGTDAAVPPLDYLTCRYYIPEFNLPSALHTLYTTVQTTQHQHGHQSDRTTSQRGL
jgi:hypothetical protein